MTFDAYQISQTDHRKAFIHECRQKAWGAACHADWIHKGLDRILDDYKKLKDDSEAADEEIKALASAPDSHTFANRTRRKELKARRNQLAEAMKALAANLRKGQDAYHALLQSIESNMQLAKHAEGWEWKDGDTK